jgi:hypothetical protein
VEANARPTICNSRTFRVAAFQRPLSVDLRGIAILSIESHSADELPKRSRKGAVFGDLAQKEAVFGPKSTFSVYR